MKLKQALKTSLAAAALTVASVSAMAAPYVVGGAAQTLIPGSQLWAWDGDYMASFRAALENPANFGPTGTVNRAIDRRVLEGIYGSIVSGQKGTVSTPFPAGQIIPVTTGGAAGNQRLNVAKVRAAKLLLEQGYVDAMEDRYMLVTANQADDLLAEIQATSGDYTKAFAARYNEKGGLSGLLGFNFVQMELANPLLSPINASPFSLDGSGFRKNPFWVKSGVRLNFWQRLRTSIDKIPGKQLSTQVWAGTTCAATRTQAGKVGIILNSEA